MHQSFVTTIPTGPLYSGAFWLFSMQSLGICPALLGHFCCQSLAKKSPTQIPAGKYEVTPAGLGLEAKAPQFHDTVWTILSSKHGTQAPLCSRPIRGRDYKWLVHYAASYVQQPLPFYLLLINVCLHQLSLLECARYSTNISSLQLFSALCRKIHSSGIIPGK